MRPSAIVVSHAGGEGLESCLRSLAPWAGSGRLEVVLVDNGSADRCGESLAGEMAWLRVVRSEHNLGFAGGVAAGVGAAGGDVLLLLNDDAAAEPAWLEAHLETLARHPHAGASAGRLVSWDAARHDFLRGAVTFDAHAFQVGQGWPVGELEAPEAGEPLPFPCGGNMAIRRADWELAGGFDPSLFAYFEDVALGWRLHAAGRPVVAAPDAVARHQGAATSARLGNFRRGVLFERNSLRAFFACADDELRAAFGPAVLATFLHRLVAFGLEREDLAHLVADPFGPLPAPPSRADRWRGRLQRDGVLGAARHLLARVLLGRRAGRAALDDGLLLMQLRSAHGFFASLEGDTARRRALEARRTVPDREVVARFPRLVVPTYLGDQGWFDSQGFASLLPAGWPLERRRLENVLHPSLLG